jgi:hypothetical protein
VLGRAVLQSGLLRRLRARPGVLGCLLGHDHFLSTVRLTVF